MILKKRRSVTSSQIPKHFLAMAKKESVAARSCLLFPEVRSVELNVVEREIVLPEAHQHHRYLLKFSYSK
jgi:hypothetical protein